ncbi:STAS domain-containing protein [candidate division KSB1 bacterium]|nr:STAS domain-containing protein [candidate division KSB1 bacterium]NIR72993.1 STAS domain-containing protein [candidate division KSB1 bacterium]NIS27746.1 STAS domain-containing protein [candidate division KSB1 bacterium]NIT74594.1 STAS domain-containing protein [candidate division KSB1 bacterium]NIU28413.1 STAS domain-containing protein [candidate division KSB1 bacterium]
MEGIQVSVEKAGLQQQISIIKVGGYIDTTTSAELEHALSSLLKSNRYNIIIDLGNVDYISSAGWGIFISEIKGIREKNGDLKLVRMIPDVFEVFELLEFHYILRAFDTLEEAIADFDQQTSTMTSLQEPKNEEESKEEGVQPTNQPETQVREEKHRTSAEPELETIEEKLRRIIIENPDSGMFQIIKTLNTPRFGNIKLGWFEMRKYLKQLDLDTKKKRLDYFKVHSFGKLTG